MAAAHLKKIDVSYDRVADVLYISFGRPRKGIAFELNDGNLVRIDPFKGTVVGITIIDFKERYMPSKNRTIEESARELVPKLLSQYQHEVNRQSKAC